MKHINNSIKTMTTILLSLISLAFLSAFILSSSSSHASTCETINGTLTCTESTTASVTVPDVCTLEDTVVGTAHTAQVSVGSYTPNIGETTIKVTCNDNNGYSLYAVGYSNNTVGNTNLIGTNGNIVTGTANDGSVSNWAMKLTAVSGSFTPTILNGYDNYHVVPDTATKVATRTESIDVSSTSEIKTTYAVSISPSQAKGDYTGKVKYTVVHPNYTNADGTLETFDIPINFAGQGVSSVTFTATGYPTRTVSTSGGTANLTAGVEYNVLASFAEEYQFVSWALNDVANGSFSSTSINPTTFVANSNSINAVITITGKSSKLWFQDATSADCGEIMYDNRGTAEYKNLAYTTGIVNGQCWMTRNLDLPALTTLNQTNTNLNDPVTTYSLPAASTAFSDNSRAYVYNSNSTTCGSNLPCYSYYSFVAATAGTSPTSGNATSDICPRGWRLPTRAEFNALKSIYLNKSGFEASPFLGVSAGVYRTNRLDAGGSNGIYWSSTALDTSMPNYAYRLEFYGFDTSVDYADKYNGYAIRCVAKT